jgi:hypothetical protein
MLLYGEKTMGVKTLRTVTEEENGTVPDIHAFEDPPSLLK